MSEFLSAVDRALFTFFNGTVGNPVFDAVMPLLTDLNKHWWGLTLFGAAWILLFWKGGRKGRVVATLLLLLVTLTDQMNSFVLKDIFQRARPCHQIAGVAAMEHLRLLVDCGSGYSFPSSHAANNFGAAFLLGFFYRSWSWAFFLFAGAVGYSRVSVGVHYPFDIVGGAAFGGLCAGAIILAWGLLAAYRPGLDFEMPAQARPAADDWQ